MNSVNPSFILRNYLLEESITKAEAGDFSMVDSLLKQAEKPYQASETPKCVPEWAHKICVSCSS